MKKIFTLLLTCIFVHFLNAQSLGIVGSNFAPTSDPCNQTSIGLTVKNLLTTDTLKVFCEKVIVDTTAGTTNNFCWGGNCYGVTTYISTDFTELGPGQSNNVDFTGYYDAFCSPATATVEYCFYPQSNPSDRSCITILYNDDGTTTAIKEYNNFITSGFYPNPASNYVNINYGLMEKANIKIIDILGNIVRDIDLSSGGQKQIYTGDLNKGVYFGNLFQRGKLVTIKKLIIK